MSSRKGLFTGKLIIKNGKAIVKKEKLWTPKGAQSR